ncbi:Acg family FMN-binding oxidoreductase [Cryptosporangium sp. NPDC048952]|uniref:Acg family FMN-binding oxidoreductase n=1 Tax=Cryptosporangium sp. NPDC048952 TaxID=3363961 RepID=UPI003722FEDC
MSDTAFTTEDLLRGAAETATRAPSIFNTQPWRWQVGDGVLELRADRGRQLAVTDPEGRMLTISCGIALHHARISLAADGQQPVVDYLPDTADPDLLARIALAGPVTPADPADSRLREAIARRHTDRRPFTDTPVPDGVVDRLRTAAEARGVYLAELGGDSMVRFQVTAARAGDLDQNDPAYQAELAEWTHRPAGSGDGIPAATTVPATPRRIPLRAFFPDGGEGLLPGPGRDGGARYLVLWTTHDGPADWLAAGEATSLALLETTASGLAASPMTDVIEIPASRTLLHRLLNNLGHAQIALRIGVPADDTAPGTPRRASAEVIETDH